MTQDQKQENLEIYLRSVISDNWSMVATALSVAGWIVWVSYEDTEDASPPYILYGRTSYGIEWEARKHCLQSVFPQLKDYAGPASCVGYRVKAKGD